MAHSLLYLGRNEGEHSNMKRPTRILVTHGICALMGFVLATAIMTGQEKSKEVPLKKLGVVIPPDTHYVDGGIQFVQHEELPNYEIMPPYSQLKLYETGGDAKGNDGKADIWMVSCMNGVAPPRIDAPIGFYGEYEDEDGDQAPDKLYLTVGTEDYQYVVRRSTESLNSTGKSREWFSIYRAGQFFTSYYDFDKDGFIDLILQRDGIDMDQEDTDLAANQWVVWEGRMYPVRDKHKTSDGLVFEIEDADGSARFVWLTGAVWEETSLN